MFWPLFNFAIMAAQCYFLVRAFAVFAASGPVAALLFVAVAAGLGALKFREKGPP